VVESAVRRWLGWLTKIWMEMKNRRTIP
jgi:hypothetical protein